MVSSSNGLCTPARLIGIALATGPQTKLNIECNCNDTGSAITLVGETDALDWVRRFPTAVRRASPLPTSIQRVRGVGVNLNNVQFWVSFRLLFGGAVIHFTDVPVLRNHRGLLLGNDFLGPGRSLIDVSARDGVDGFVTLRGPGGRSISEPVAFCHHTQSPPPAPTDVNTVDVNSASLDPDPAVSPPTDMSKCSSRTPHVNFKLSVGSGGVVTSTPSISSVTAADEAIIRDVAPVAFTPKRTRIEPWCEADIWLRVPSAAVSDAPIALLPLEDARLKDLHVLVSPGISQPTADGYVNCRVINMALHPVEIPKLTPVARFILDPRLTNADIEFTVDEILEKIHVRDGLSEGELLKLRAMLVIRRRLFRSTLGYVHGAKMSIRMPKVESGEEAPPSDRNRVRPPPEERALKKEVDKQLKGRLIEPANSPFNAIPMLIRKPGLGADGEPLYRVVIDYRKVNLLTEKNTYPLPNAKHNLASLGKANWFTTLDLLQGFHQVELDPASRPATAFGTPWGQYQYTRAPMGLTSSPGTFVQLVDSALRGLPPGIAVAYVDDVIIPTNGSFADHLRDVGLVFDRLIESGFAVRCDKVHLGMQEVPYLGFLVGAYGTKPLESKTSAVTSLRCEDLGDDPGAAARFTGMISFYSEFIPGLHNTLAPFHKLKQKGVDSKSIMRSLKFKAAFALLRHQLATATANTRPDYTKPFYIDVDAATSGGIGACLFQYSDEGCACPIAFWSRRFTTEERRYGVRDQECLGLSEALSQWRHYILGARVIVRSDHKSLKWLLSTMHPDGSRVATWALRAQGYDVEIVWIPGRDHVAPDFFSRSTKEEGEVPGSNSDPFSDRLLIEERLQESLDAIDSSSARTFMASDEYASIRAAYDESLSGLYDSTLRRIREASAFVSSAGSVVDYLYNQLDITGVTADVSTADAAKSAEDASPLVVQASQAFVFSDTFTETPKLLVFDRIHDGGLTFVPGGKMEPYDSSPLLTCRRELFEETGFVAPFGSIIHSPLADPIGTHKGTFILHDFAISVDTSQISQFRNREPRKHSNMRWLPVKELTFENYLDRLPERATAALHAVNGSPYSSLSCPATPSATLSYGVRQRALRFIRRLRSLLHARRRRARARLARVGQRLARRVAVVVIRKRDDALSILVERIEDEYTLPSTPASQQQPYRVDISQRLQNVYDHASMLQLSPALRSASSHHCHRQAEGGTHYFVAVVPSDFETPASLFGHVTFTALSASIPLFANPEDSVFVSNVYRQAHSRGPALGWQGSFKRLRAALVSNATVNTTISSTTPTTIPNIIDNPCGPALCVSSDHAAIAVNRMLNRLKSNPGHPLSLDLEGRLGGAHGHVALLQAAVDGVEDDAEPLVYVFDTHVNRGILSQTGPSSLRALLENPSIPKVWHCCYGDVGSLYHEYGILAKGTFDTALADCILLRNEVNKARGLASVLCDWLGHDAVTLTHKGAIDFEENVFIQRPLDAKLFVYAYEDVTFCGQLYNRLVEALHVKGVYELACTLSQQRCPPVQLPIGHPSYQQPTRIAIGLCDWCSVLCLHDTSTGTVCLPNVPYDPQASHKSQASAAWSHIMGAPAKGLRSAINARMRRPVRLGDTLLFLTFVPDCSTLLSDLASASDAHHLEAFSSRPSACGLLLRPRVNACNACSQLLVHSTQLVSFQYIQVYTMGLSAPSSSLTHAYHVSHPCSPPLVPSVNIALGKVHEGNKRAAVVVHDGTHAFVVVSRDGSFSFPSHPVEIGGDATDAALKGFDNFAGVSLRKSSGHLGATFALPVLPNTSSYMRSSFDNMLELRPPVIDPSFHFGNTVFFSCYVPDLHQLRLSFHSSRMPDNGFELTEKVKARHPGADIVPIDYALNYLAEFDRIAIEASLIARDLPAVSRREYASNHLNAAPIVSLAELTPGLHAQHSDTVHPDVDDGCSETGSLSQHSDTCSTTATGREMFIADDPSLPDLGAVGADTEVDSLLTAAALVYYARFFSQRPAAECFNNEPASDPAEGAPDTAAKSAPPASLKYRFPTRTEIIAAQLAHPGTSQFIEFLRFSSSDVGDDDILLASPDVEQRKAFLDEASHLFLSPSDGLLLHRGLKPGDPPRIVIPPPLQQSILYICHDRSGHLGVRKVLPHVMRRFYWGSPTFMRGTVASYIRGCLHCQRIKVPHHGTGEHQIDHVGSCPNDVLSGDGFYAGVNSDGYDSTLDFADNFTRGVTSTATKGDPSSEEVCRILIEHIIRHHGVPSEIRVDAARTMISVALSELYKRFGIKIKIGTAYTHKLVALVERWHQTLKQLLAIDRLEFGSEGWYKRLPLLELCFNAAVNATTGYSPFFLSHLRHARLPVDAMTHDYTSNSPADIPQWVKDHLITLNVVYDAVTRTLRINSLSQKKQYDLRHDVVTSFQPGDRVLLIRGTYFDKRAVHPKALEPTDGPFTILRSLPFDRYVLTDLGTRRIREEVHVSRLLPFHQRSAPENKWFYKDADNGGSWPVERIVGRRRASTFDKVLGTTPVWEYRLRWLGFAPQYDSWRSRPYLDSLAELISAYNAANPEGYFDSSLPPLAVEDRATDIAAPPASEPARHKPHFHRGSLRPAPGDSPPSAPPPPPELAAADASPTLDSNADRFPVHSRVHVRYKDSKEPWAGTVVKSWVTRPRKPGNLPERLITVHYDDYRYQHQLFTHSVNASDITLIPNARDTRAAARSKRLSESLVVQSLNVRPS